MFIVYCLGKVEEKKYMEALVEEKRTAMIVKIFETLGKIPEILKPQVIFLLQLRR